MIFEHCTALYLRCTFYWYSTFITRCDNCKCQRFHFFGTCEEKKKKFGGDKKKRFENKPVTVTDQQVVIDHATEDEEYSDEELYEAGYFNYSVQIRNNQPNNQKQNTVESDPDEDYETTYNKLPWNKTREIEEYLEEIKNEDDNESFDNDSETEDEDANDSNY